MDLEYMSIIGIPSLIGQYFFSGSRVSLLDLPFLL